MASKNSKFGNIYMVIGKTTTQVKYELNKSIISMEWGWVRLCGIVIWPKFNKQITALETFNCKVYHFETEIDNEFPILNDTLCSTGFKISYLFVKFL